MKTNPWILPCLILCTIGAGCGSRKSHNDQAEEAVSSLTPAKLVGMAYQGYFRDHGIPGYARFCTQANTRKVTADHLVAIAVVSGRLDAGIVNDRYIGRVRQQMRTVCRD